MKPERVSQLLFLVATSVALLVYCLSAPSTLPWGLEVRMAAETDGGVSAAWRIWGYFVEMFAGRFVALACVAAAIAAGLLAMTVNRYLGWRVATAAALVWTFLPGVWNGTALGMRGVCVASGAVILLWEIERIGHRVLRRARAARRAAPTTDDVLGAPPSKWNGRLAWGMLGAAGVFALASVLAHDWQLGEAAGVYARGVVREAGDRIIVLNGVADEQVMEAQVEKTGGGGDGRISSIPSERGYRPAEFAAQVRAAWPDQTNYWVAAEIGPDAFLREASKEHGARFYRMDGRDSTLGGWERRWEEAKAYLKSDDPFVPVMRRVFAREGNCIANAMLELESRVGGGERSLPSCARSALTSDEDVASPLTGQHGRARTPAAPQSLHNEIAVKRDCGGPGVSALPQWNESGAKRHVHSATPTQNSNSSAALAWQMYKRIYAEVDPGNFAALVNQYEMIRRGYKVSEEERRRVHRQLDDFFADPVRRSRAREIARSSGPVRSDPELIARLERESRQRVAEKVARGELKDLPKSWMTLVEWNNEMIAAVGRGDRAKATRIARAILSNERWDGFIPANAILGTATAAQGDYAAAEVFFRKATSTTNAVPAVVLNDYAHTLMCLGKLDEAEKTARRVVETDKTLRIARRTLREILEKRRREKGGAR